MSGRNSGLAIPGSDPPNQVRAPGVALGQWGENHSQRGDPA